MPTDPALAAPLKDPPPWVEGMAFSRLQFAWEDCTPRQLLAWLDDAGPTDQARRAVVGALAELRLAALLSGHRGAKFAAPFVEAVESYAGGGAYDAALVAKLRDRAEGYRYEEPAGLRDANAAVRASVSCRMLAVLDLLLPATRPLALTLSDADSGLVPGLAELAGLDLAGEVRRRLPNPPPGYREPNPPRRWRA